MELYDILMLVVIAAAGIFGAYKGFAWQLASIASIVTSYFVAYRFREPLSHSIVAEPPWNQFLAMLILFVGTSLIVWVAFNMVRQTIDRMRLKEFDRQVGALFGLLKGGLYCTLITLFAVTLMGDSVREKIVASKSGRFISRNLDRSESVIPAEIHQFLGPYLERFDAEFQEGQIDSAAGIASQLIDRSGTPFVENANRWVNDASQQLSPVLSAGSQSAVQPSPQSAVQPGPQSGMQPGMLPNAQPTSLFPGGTPASWRP